MIDLICPTTAGWITLYDRPSPVAPAEPSSTTAPWPAAAPAAEAAAGKRKQPEQCNDESYYDDYYAAYESEPAEQPPPPPQQQQQRPGGDAAGSQDEQQPAWHDAVREGAHFAVPATAAAAAAVNAGV